MTTTANNIATREQQARDRAIAALATLTTSDLLAIADALDMTIAADARAIAAADARAEAAGRRRWSDGRYSGQHRATDAKRDRAPHLRAAREVMTTAISATFMAEKCAPGGTWHNR